MGRLLHTEPGFFSPRISTSSCCHDSTGILNFVPPVLPEGYRQCQGGTSAVCHLSFRLLALWQVVEQCGNSATMTPTWAKGGSQSRAFLSVGGNDNRTMET